MRKPEQEKKLSGGQLVLLLAAVLLGLTALCLCVLIFGDFIALAEDAPANQIEHVFLFVGDGMGINHLAATRYFQSVRDGTDTLSIWRDSFDSFPSIGLMSTHSLEMPTDSAASITAMLTGHKVHNQEMNYSSEEGRALTPLASILREHGYAVGVVTSTSVDHATPAGMYAVAQSRYDYSTIAMQAIVPDYLNFLGGGGFRAEPYDALIAQAEKNGFEVYEGAHAVREIGAGSAPVLALSHGPLSKYELSNEIDRARAAKYGGTDLALSELLRACIRRLEGQSPFVVLCEGAKIDIACTDGDLTTALYEVEALDGAVQEAMAFYQAHPENTLIVVLADHETGGLRIRSDADFGVLTGQLASAQRFREIMQELYESGGDFDEAMEKAAHYFNVSADALGSSRLADLQEAFEDSRKEGSDDFTKELLELMQDQSSLSLETANHTGQPVCVYALGAQAHLFEGVYDNTDIYGKLMQALQIAQ